MDYTVKITGLDKLKAQLGNVASEARARLRVEVNTLGLLLATWVQQNKLRGQVLKQRSGRLISSIHHELQETDAEVNALVGTNVEYAAAHELGFTGSVQVKEHYRTIKKAWGRPIDPRRVLVRAHPMSMNMPQRAFLAPSLEEFRPQALQRMHNFVKLLVEAK